MSKLFSNGCSFLTPRPKDGVNTFVSKIISNHYNLKLYNFAKGGRGNDRISFTTKVWFESNSTEQTFVVIGWSSSLRNDYITNDGWKLDEIPGDDFSWRSYNFLKLPTKFYNKIKNFDLDATSAVRWVNHVIDLQTYFKYKKIPYVMYNALPPFIDLKNETFKMLYDKIDHKSFFNFTTSHYDFIVHNNYIVSKDDPHPSNKGHQVWAEKLIEFINSNELFPLK